MDRELGARQETILQQGNRPGRIGREQIIRWEEGKRRYPLSTEMDLSLIVPCYNEESNVGAFLKDATACFDDANLAYELVFVDDGSTDNTVSVLKEDISAYLSRKGSDEGCSCASFRVIELSRNFGKESALYAGLKNASGECSCFIDADLQQPPCFALSMYRDLCENPDIDIVAAAPSKRRESLFLRASKKAFYRMFNNLSETKLLADVSDFRVFRRQVGETLLNMPEQYRFSKGLFSWVGFRTKVVEYDVQERFAGKSKWTFRGLLSYAWNGVLSFSRCPLSLISALGITLLIASVLFAAGTACESFLFHQTVSTLFVVLVAVVFLTGVQLIGLGIVGEYSSRSYIEGKRRPVYIARCESEYSAARTSKPAFKVLHDASETGKILPFKGTAVGSARARSGSSFDENRAAAANEAKFRVVIGGASRNKRS